MTTAKFYVSTASILEGTLDLRGDSHHHLSRVLRVKRGQRIEVLDGAGLRGLASVMEIKPDRTVVRIEEVREVEEETPRLHIFQALTAGRKMDVTVQTGVELGMTSLTPFSCIRSKPLESADGVKLKRWRRISLESARVAGRPFLPRIGEPLSWENLIGELPSIGIVLVADERGGARPCTALEGIHSSDVGLLIGPEGGFVEGEREALADIGAIPVTLGSLILRTETAGMVLLAAVRSHYGWI